MTHKVILTGVVLLAFPVFLFAQIGDYAPERAGAGKPELHITAEGMMTLKSGRVVQIAGTTLYLTIKWGQIPMSFVMKTDARTNVVKRYGGATTVSSIKVGDYLDAEGEFSVGSDTLGLIARTVKDYSQTEESESFSGRIIELNSASFVLQTPSKNIVVVPAPAVSIQKGEVSLPWGRLAKGDTVPLADGVYDYAKNTLTASKILVYHSKEEFTPRNFQGTLKRVDGTTLPATLIVTVQGIDYTVYLSPSTKVLTNARKTALLGRFVVGDTIRFYGALKESDKLLADQLVVPAEIVRNTSL